jgi:hypothetical protein
MLKGSRVVNKRKSGMTKLTEVKKIGEILRRVQKSKRMDYGWREG